MFKKLLPFLLIPVLLFSAEIKMNYDFHTPQILNGIVYLKGCRITREAFAPCVAVKPVKLLLPYGQKAVSFSVKYDEPILLDEEYHLKPFRPGGRISIGPPAGYYTRRSSAYDKDEFYPTAVRSENFYNQYKNGNAIFVTTLNPVQYNPVSGKIKYFKNISVTVHTEATRAPVYKFTPFIKSQLALQVDNPEELSKLTYSKKAADDYEYLIVTFEKVEDAFGEFVDFNKRRGMRSKVETIENITSTVDGDDDADKLRNYIIDEYENHNIVFVLLAGDADPSSSDKVPHRGMHSSCYDYGSIYLDDKDMPADLYYSCLDGDWKNGNQYYGEYGTEDIEWEVYAARFAVDNKAELDAMIQKTIKYTEEPVVDETVNNLLLGEYAWGPPDHPVECWGKPLMAQFVGECTANGFTTIGFGDNWNTTGLYDKDQTWSKTSLINAVKDDKITWINHIGHSNNNYIMKLYSSDVTNSNFTNDGTNANFFIAYTYGCYPGAFDNKTPGGTYTSDCIGEQFTAGITNGAVSFISCTRSGLGDDGTASDDGTDGSNQRILRYFHDAIFDKKIHYQEMMNAYSKEVNVDLITDSDIESPPYFGQMKWCAYQVNILGDPALSVWTKIPEELDPDFKIENKIFKMQTGPYTWVALESAKADIICSQLTGEDGVCEIDDEALKEYITANPNGKLTLRIKAHNYLPHESEIDLATAISNDINQKFSYASTFNSPGEITKISYKLLGNGFVNISIYNSKGSLIKIIVNENQSAGKHSVTFNINDFSNGIYYCRMTANNNTLVNKFIVAK